MRAEKKARKAAWKSLDRRRKCDQCVHKRKKKQLSHKGAACLSPRRGEVSRSDGEGPPCLPAGGRTSPFGGFLALYEFAVPFSFTDLFPPGGDKPPPLLLCHTLNFAFHLIRHGPCGRRAAPPSPRGEGLNSRVSWLPLEGKLSRQRLMRCCINSVMFEL